MATMNISLSDDLRDFVESEVQARSFSSSSEYVRQLVREKRDEVALRSKLVDGFASAPSTMSSQELFQGLQETARSGAQ